MKKYLVLFLFLSSCQVAEVEPLIFDNYFFGNGNFTDFKIEDFYANYKISADGIVLKDGDNLYDVAYYGNRPNQFSFSQLNNKFYIEYPLFASRGRNTSTSLFYIQKTEILLNNFEISFTNDFENNGNGIETFVKAKGLINKQTRTIDLKVEYYNGDSFNRPKYNLNLEPDIVKNFTYKYYSKL